MVDTVSTVKKNLGFKIVVIVLMVMFLAFYGAQDLMINLLDKRPMALKIGNYFVPRQELDEIYNDQLKLEMPGLKHFTSEHDLELEGVFNKSMELLAENSFINLLAKEYNITINNTLVFNYFKNNHEEFGFKEKMDFKELQAKLKNSGISEQDFVERYRKFLAKYYLLRTFAVHFSLPKEYSDLYYRAMHHRRKIEYVDIPLDSILIEKPSDSQLEAVLQKHQADFIFPESRDVVVFNVDASAIDVEILDREIDNYYQEKRADLVLPETRDVNFIMLKEKNKVEMVKMCLSGGGNFDTVRRQIPDISINEEKNLVKNSLPKALGDAIFVLREGENSKTPLEVKDMFIFYQISKINPSREQTMDEVRHILKEEIALAKKQKVIIKMFEDLKQRIVHNKGYQPEHMIKTAKELNINGKIFNKINPDTVIIENFVKAEKKIEKNKEKKEDTREEKDENDEMVDLIMGVGNGVMVNCGSYKDKYYYAITTEIYPERPLTMVEASKELNQIYRHDQYAVIFKEYLDMVAENIKNGKGFKDALTMASEKLKILKNIKMPDCATMVDKTLAQDDLDFVKPFVADQENTKIVQEEMDKIYNMVTHDVILLRKDNKARLIFLKGLEELSQEGTDEFNLSLQQEMIHNFPKLIAQYYLKMRKFSLKVLQSRSEYIKLVKKSYNKL